MSASAALTRSELAARLRGRRVELEQTAMARVYGISEPSQVDPEYLVGLQTSVAAALDYALAAIESGEAEAPQVPEALLVQARLAARNGVGIDTVMRRYLAGYSLVGEFFLGEAEACGAENHDTKALMGGQAALFDRLLAAVAEEHRREAAARPTGVEQQRVERVKRLLAGETIDPGPLGYALDGCHLGVVGTGGGVVETVRDLAKRFDQRKLIVRCDGDRVWAWLGSRAQVDRSRLGHLIARARAGTAADAVLAFGDSAEGSHGWRLTHRQAVSALPVAQETGETVVLYSDVALLATVLQDDVTSTSLRQLYLRPLEEGPDRGAALRATLKAYFAAGGRISSTAAGLGVSRRTVTNRLRVTEQRLGRQVDSMSAELQVALRLAELDQRSARAERHRRSSPGNELGSMQPRA